MCINDTVYELVFRSLDAFVLSDTSEFFLLERNFTKKIQFKFLSVETHIGFKTPNTLQ